MTHEDGRVTILPSQIRRLAALSEESNRAIEIVQTGNVLRFNDGNTKLSVDAHGQDIRKPNPNQETLC
jgi:hypothetical protein